MAHEIVTVPILGLENLADVSTECFSPQGKSIQLKRWQDFLI